MSANTGIAWCDSTFNPWIGCTKVGPGCDNCYAKADFDDRKHRVVWGPGQARSRTKTWGDPVKWNAQPFFECPDCGARGTAQDMGDEPKACKHLRAAPARRRVFCASLADVFDNEVDIIWLADLLQLIWLTPNLDWLLLTKRIGNALPRVQEAAKRKEAYGMAATWLHGTPPENVWLGATVVNQEEADRDIPKLLDTPARVRFLSMEPLLGSVDIRPFMPNELWNDIPSWKQPELDWVIAGGESGPGARPSQLQWFRSIVKQCRAAGVPVMMKQLGGIVLDDGMASPGEHWPAGMVRENHPRHTEFDPGFSMRLKDRKGGDISEWPEDLQVREFPNAN